MGFFTTGEALSRSGNDRRRRSARHELGLFGPRESNPPSRGQGEVSDVFTTDRVYSGEYSRRLHPLRGVACSTAELRKGASPSRRIRTSDLAITDATDLFTTGEQVWPARRARTMEVAGEQVISEVPRSKRGGLLAKRSPPATHRPSQGRFHGTIEQGRDSNPLSMVRSIRNPHHQRMKKKAPRNTAVS
jgi:hypothetical protein